MANLYEINEELERLYENSVNEDGEIDEAALAQIESLEMDRSTKIDNLACLIKNLTSDAEAIKAEADKLTGYAKKALLAGNEGDAKIFVSKKQDLESQIKSLELAYETAKANADKMKQLHDKLTADIQQLEAKKAAIKAKVSVAETQQTVNKYTYSSDKFDQTVAAVQRMEDKANKMLDEATAMAELNAQPIDEAKVIEEKYKNGETASVNEELEALKKELGLVEE